MGSLNMTLAPILLSLLVHVVTLLSLALLVLPPPRVSVVPHVISTLLGPEEVEIPTDENVDLIEITNFDEEQTSFAFDDVSPVASLDNPVVPAGYQSLEIPVTPPAISVSQSFPDLLEPLERAALEIDAELAPRQAGGNEACIGVAGVIDRLTGEIVKHAAGHEVVVYWLLDASLSVSKQREQIADRLDKVVKQLAADKMLKSVRHQIYGFGQALTEITKEATDDAKVLSKDVRSVTLDTSGIENIFGAIDQVIRRRVDKSETRAVIMVVTDEVGDDQSRVDEVAALATRKMATIYVLGAPAPFGLGTCRFKFVDPDPAFDQAPRMVEVEQGPETPRKMTLNIATLPIDRLPLDSGFGPYALSRICSETGGLYFAAHPNRRHDKPLALADISPMASNITTFFDPAIMRHYAPEYSRSERFTRALAKNPAKSALVRVCSGTACLEISFPTEQRFPSTDPGKLRQHLSQAQRDAVKAVSELDLLCEQLDTKAVLKHADSLKLEPRWDASFKLALGRLLATKVRLDAWNEMLGIAKGGLTPVRQNTNVWTIKPSKDLNKALEAVNSLTKKRADRAIECFKDVIQNYPDTPWAAVAVAELEAPMAYAWEEGFDPGLVPAPKPNPNEQAPVASPASARARPDDKPVILKPKPKREINKI
jgi:hypothetical protein